MAVALVLKTDGLYLSDNFESVFMCFNYLCVVRH